MSVVAISTTTRAEWGLLRPFAVALQDLGVEVRIVASGTHLSHEYGFTISEVKESGLPIDAEIPILADGDDALAEAMTMSNALGGFSKYFASRRPDALLVLGDRFETLGIAEAAFLARIPIFHIHGGEVTEGAIDDALRHCITKLSTLHFTSTEEYKKRVIQLGEDPSRVFNVGAVGVENALQVDRLDHSSLEESLGIVLPRPYAIMTYHPVTLAEEDPVDKLDQLLAAIQKKQEIFFVATKANADAGGRAINERLESFARSNANLALFDSLGSQRYLSAISRAAFVIGNSSSGLLEAPAFGVPTVNIGARQKGRIRPKSVIDCKEDTESILCAIDRALEPAFRASIQMMDNPYGKGATSREVAKIIVRALSKSINLEKAFFDLTPCS